ncbi:MAG: glycosyltransferase [Chlorobi bacterium]|nr:glycosyltransferase [Chlorobiota bacterium]
MKNLIIGPAYPLRGGIANFSHALGLAFKKQGMETGVVSFSYQYPSFLFPGKTQKDISSPPPPIPVYPLISSVNPFTWKPSAKFILEKSPDFIVVQYWTPYLAPALRGVVKRLGSKKPFPVIGLTHNITPHEGGLMDRYLTRRFLSQCDGFITLSATVRNELEKLYPGKPAHFIPHPVYDIFGDPVSQSEGIRYLDLNPAYRYLLFFGIIRPYKGLDILLEALSLLRDHDPPLRLIIAGEFYDKKEKYMKMIRKHHLSEMIIMHDRFIPGEEVKYFFAASDLVVQPYRTASQSGITQMAYHFGKPMVVTRVGGLPELVADGRTGWVCDTSPEAVADGIRNYFKISRPGEIRNNIQMEKKRFSWESMVNGMVEMAAELQ